jgi:hypothetical protein
LTNLVKYSIINKIDITLKKIIKQLRNILEENPEFTGSIDINFCRGGVSSIGKKENLKIK